MILNYNVKQNMYIGVYPKYVLPVLRLMMEGRDVILWNEQNVGFIHKIECNIFLYLNI